jgi:hypothetical protein
MEFCFSGSNPGFFKQTHEKAELALLLTHLIRCA